MVDGGVGIAAVVGLGSKFVERSKFTARHDACCDKEAEKTQKLAERFDRIPQEDVDHFEFQEYTMLHSKLIEDLRHYREVQEEYKEQEWYKKPVEKFRIRGRVRQVKRSLQSSSAREEQHLHELETYSRANSSRSSSIHSHADSESGLDLGRFSRPYRTDSCSIRAMGGSPPSASLEDICSDEKKAQIVDNVSAWLSSQGMDSSCPSSSPPLSAGGVPAEWQDDRRGSFASVSSLLSAMVDMDSEAMSISSVSGMGIDSMAGAVRPPLWDGAFYEEDWEYLQEQYPPPPPPASRRRSRPTTPLPVPIPVPNLIKKSRGRDVSTNSSLEDLRSAASGAGRKRQPANGSNTRMYQCDVEGCGKCFARGEHLKRHMRAIHTHEKPHRCPCPGCGKDFSR